MDTLYTFGDNITHYKTESVHFSGVLGIYQKVVVPTLRLSLETGLGFVCDMPSFATGCLENIAFILIPPDQVSIPSPKL